MSDDIVTRLDAFANEHYDGECMWGNPCEPHHAYADLAWEASSTIGRLRWLGDEMARCYQTFGPSTEMRDAVAAWEETRRG